MDRLTEPKRNDNGTAIAKKDLVIRGMPSNYCSHIVDKLADYEDLEDQGLLVKLPCKVGTTVYHIVPVDTNSRKAIIEHEADLFFILVATVEERWGKTVFLTEQEAEESLRKE